MPKLDLHSVIQGDPEIIAAEAGKDVVMVSIENGQYYGISLVAKEIWQAIEQPTRVSNLISDLVANYSVDRRVCEKDTLAFLEQLLAERLLLVKNGSSS